MVSHVSTVPRQPARPTIPTHRQSINSERKLESVQKKDKICRELGVPKIIYGVGRGRSERGRVPRREDVFFARIKNGVAFSPLLAPHLNYNDAATCGAAVQTNPAERRPSGGKRSGRSRIAQIGASCRGYFSRQVRLRCLHRSPDGLAP